MIVCFICSFVRYLFIHSFIHSFIQLFVRLFVHYLLVYLIVCFLVCLWVHSFVSSFIHLINQSINLAEFGPSPFQDGGDEIHFIQTQRLFTIYTKFPEVSRFHFGKFRNDTNAFHLSRTGMYPTRAQGLSAFPTSSSTVLH